MMDIAPPPGPARQFPPTRQALRRNWWIRWPLLLTALATGPLTVVLINNYADAAALVASQYFIFGTMFGGCFVWINRRRRKALRNPWTVWRIRYLSGGRYEWVDLLGPQGETAGTLLLSTWAWDRGKLVDHATREIWFAGDPARYGIVSRPGGRDMRYAYVSRVYKPPRFTFREDAGGPRVPGAGRHSSD